ncbi:MAG TPA: ZPR1 zinc finger domain-containing protein [Candidatus Woesearchaeota archaeon]|nr:ZPR1 zinc finger domain-containing protein [Candidatus Woesearchaeota archaeon]
MEEESYEIETLENQKCPMCGQNTLTLLESEREIPYFKKVFLFSMSCSSCHYHSSDVEVADAGEPLKFTFEVQDEKDLNVRVIKSSEAVVKVGRIATIEPGIASNGYITNIEGLLSRVKSQLEFAAESEEDEDAVKKAKAHLKKIRRILWGSDPVTIIISDKTGNSAIVSDKAKIEKLK